MKILLPVLLLLSSAAIAQEAVSVQTTTLVDAAGKFGGSVETFRYARKTTNQSMSSTTPADVVGLRFGAKPNETYSFDVYVVTSTAVGTTGIQLGINGPASPTALSVKIQCPTASGTPAEIDVNAYETFLANATSAGATRVVCRVTGVLVN